MATTYSNLSRGSKGESVRKMQQSLINAGYDVGSSGADGNYGPATESAVRRYQKDNGLSVDGIAGNNTLGKLYGTNSTSSKTTSSGTKATAKSTVPTYNPASDKAYQSANAALDAAKKNMPKYAGTYDGQLKELYDQIVNRDPFSYDINKDMLYQQYANEYARNGKLAMMDTMGQAAALTGGYGSSYGQQVGQQTYNAYLQQLGDIVPDLYDKAYAHYQDEGDQLMQQYAMMGDLADDEYAKFLDSYNRWAADREYAQNEVDKAYDRGYQDYLTKLGQYNTDREYQLDLDQLKFNKEQAQKKNIVSTGGSSGGRRTSGSRSSSASSKKTTEKDKPVEKYTSSRALNEAVENGKTLEERLINLKAMLDEGNITEKQYKDLSMALNPRYSNK